MKEALRLHPGVAYPLERYVPPEGATFCDVEIPGGTNVSITAPVVHMDKTVYGADADDFRPERWLEAEPERLKLMERSFLAVRLLLSRCRNGWANDYCVVRCWHADVYRQEHLHPRDGQIHSADPATFRP